MEIREIQSPNSYDTDEIIFEIFSFKSYKKKKQTRNFKNLMNHFGYINTEGIC
jgi:hypothetical protein